jgi:hypothetical protein
MRPFVSAVALGLLLAFPALASECTDSDGLKSIAEARGHTWTVVTMEQWEFLRGVSAGAPGMPDGLPIGDSAALVADKGMAGGYVIFLDGKLACFPIMPLDKGFIEMILSVGRGDVTHSGHVM